MDNIPEKWSDIECCKNCKGVIQGFCHPANTPTKALEGECEKLPRTNRKGKVVVQG